MYTFCIRSTNFGNLSGGVLTNLITWFNYRKALGEEMFREFNFSVM